MPARPRHRPRRARLAPGPFATALLTTALLAACAQPPPVPVSEDLVVEDALASNLAGGEPRQVHCGWETRFARLLRPREVLTASVTLGEAPRLALSTCGPRRGPDPGAPGPGGELRLTVAAAGDGEPGAASGSGAPIEAALPLAGPAAWRRSEVDLAALAGRRVTVRLEARVGGNRRAFLEDLVIEHRAPAPRRRGRPTQVLLISADTLRHDVLGGAGGPATPALDRLAAAGETFTPHYAAATWTKPSHAVLLTGYGVGVLRPLGFEDPLPESVPTLAGRFRAAGFRTAGLVHDCVWLDPKYGFGRGFQEYRSVKWGGEQQVRAAADWMTAHRGEPFFYFLHLFDAHSDFHRLPYEAPGVTPETVERRFGVADYGCRDGECASWMLVGINEERIAPAPGDAEILRFLYDRGVERLDAALGALFDRLAAAGLWDDLTIVFTSDHGEAFLEHGKVTHHTWHEEVLRVPLIVKWRGGERAGAVRRGPSGSVDVAPTLLAAAGVAAEDLPGDDLRRRRADRPVFAGTFARAVIQGSTKAVFSLEGEPAQLFDLAADPGERTDLAARRPDELARLGALLEARAAADERLRAQLAAAAAAAAEPGGAALLTAEERARLRALGYVDGAGGERFEPAP